MPDMSVRTAFLFLVLLFLLTTIPLIAQPYQAEIEVYGRDRDRAPYRVTGDATTSFSGHAAFLVKDDLAAGPLLRYDYRDAGSLEYETLVVAAMADVYGRNIRMRWVLGATRYHYRSPDFGGRSSDKIWSILVENHMALDGDVTGYTHIISLRIQKGELTFRYAPVLEFALNEWLTTGPLFDGSFGAYTGGVAIRAEVGLSVRAYFKSAIFLHLTPRYPIWSYDDHQINGVFLTGGVGIRL